MGPGRLRRGLGLQWWHILSLSEVVPWPHFPLTYNESGPEAERYQDCRLNSKRHHVLHSGS